MAEAAGAVIDYMGEENMLYISVRNNLSVDCDCDSSPEKPDMHDIGILASLDPVALDQACVDLENREHCLEILYAMKRNIQKQLSDMNHAKAQLEYIIKKHKAPKSVHYIETGDTYVKESLSGRGGSDHSSYADSLL